MPCSQLRYRLTLHNMKTVKGQLTARQQAFCQHYTGAARRTAVPATARRGTQCGTTRAPSFVCPRTVWSRTLCLRAEIAGFVPAGDFERALLLQCHVSLRMPCTALVEALLARQCADGLWPARCSVAPGAARVGGALGSDRFWPGFYRRSGGVHHRNCIGGPRPLCPPDSLKHGEALQRSTHGARCHAS